METKEKLEDVIQISSCQAQYANSIVTALCKDGTIWQKDVGPSHTWKQIN